MALVSENRRLAASAGSGQATGQRSHTKTRHIQAPTHPIPQLQGPFEESIIEVVEGGDDWVVDIDAQTRRRDLLESDNYERLCGRKWRQRAGERYHPFWKITSQMSFGIHLLTKRLAKSELEVLRILQSHVDEVDGFLQRTTEDFFIIQLDVHTRIQYLSLPLENLDVFDEMLDDRNFRRSMIDYNDAIEHAIGRFTTAVDDTLKDIQKGKEAIGALWNFIGQSAKENNPLSTKLKAIYNAMLANTEGWNMALSKLRRRGTALAKALSQLGQAVTEMSRRVGVASRKEVVSPATTPKRLSRSRSIKERLFEKGLSVTVTSCPPTPEEKPLPRDPGTLEEANSPPKNVRRLRSTRKSFPNLRPIQESGNQNVEEGPPSRPNSADQVKDESNLPAAIPRTQRSLSRKISMSMLPKRSVSENLGSPQERPSTAPTRTLKSRSSSMEQLNSFKTSRRFQQDLRLSPTVETKCFHEPKTKQTAPKQTDAQVSSRQENIKDQLSHYFKSDKVMDAWETSNKENRATSSSSNKRREWPFSVFRARSSNALNGADGHRATIFEQDLEQQMAWLQKETAALKTYSLKPKKYELGPRIHVVSIDSVLAEEDEDEEDENDDAATIRGETGSIITALPSVPRNSMSRKNSVADDGGRPVTQFVPP